jgi:hypothetical protein
MSAARVRAAAVLLGNGKVLITGGYGQGALSSAELFDPATGRFIPTGSMTFARYAHTATLLDDGRVLIAGGNSGAAPVAIAEIYDPLSGTFGIAGAMSTPRFDHSAVLLNTGATLIVGGTNASGSIAQGEIFSDGVFAPAGNMNAARAQAAVARAGDGRVIIAGGVQSNRGQSIVISNVEQYDTKSGFQFLTTQNLLPISGGAAVTLLDGRVLMFGAHTVFCVLFDPSNNSFRLLRGVTPRNTITATRLRGGNVLLTGGKTTQVFSPLDESFHDAVSLNIERTLHTAVLLSDGRVLIAGGADAGGTPLASAEIINLISIRRRAVRE